MVFSHLHDTVYEHHGARHVDEDGSVPASGEGSATTGFAEQGGSGAGHRGSRVGRGQEDWQQRHVTNRDFLEHAFDCMLLSTISVTGICSERREYATPSNNGGWATPYRVLSPVIHDRFFG